MKVKNYSFGQVRDVIALRVLVDDTSMAYRALGIIHASWKPIPGTFKDYVSMQKPNGYQALHTCVIINKKILEIHIQTYEMHQQSEFGVAAHFKYKEKQTGILGIKRRLFQGLLKPSSVKKQTNWLETMSKLNQKTEEYESHFAEDAETDFLQDRMFIFTPKGEVVDLPKEATVLDFAFAIHSDIGLRAEGAFVNAKHTSIKAELKNGDVVHVREGKSPKATIKWLDIVKTAQARSQIRAFIKKNS